MQIKELIERYKGDIEFDVKSINKDGDVIDVVSFNTTEAEAIKESIMGAEVHKFQIVMPTYNTCKLAITIKTPAAETTETPKEDAGSEIVP